MVDVEILRRDALQVRLKGIHPGANRIAWRAEDVARLSQKLADLPAGILRDAPVAAREFGRSNAEAGKLSDHAVNQAMSANDLNFLFPVSSQRVDLAGDSVNPAGIDCTDFNGNPVILNSHESSALPIAISSRPWVSNNKLMAIAKFPPIGTAMASDAVANAIRANLVRGASIGFIPLEWSLSKDRARPLGVDFHAVKLLEWSVCGIPCNPDCILIGVTASGNKSSADALLARLVEARKTSLTRDRIPLTPDQRLIEARNFLRGARDRT